MEPKDTKRCEIRLEELGGVWAAIPPVQPCKSGERAAPVQKRSCSQGGAGHCHPSHADGESMKCGTVKQ